MIVKQYFTDTKFQENNVITPKFKTNTQKKSFNVLLESIFWI